MSDITSIIAQVDANAILYALLATTHLVLALMKLAKRDWVGAICYLIATVVYLTLAHGYIHKQEFVDQTETVTVATSGENAALTR